MALYHFLTNTYTYHTTWPPHRIHKKLPKWMAKLIPVDSLRESLQEYASTVRVFVNKLWPSENVQETYRFQLYIKAVRSCDKLNALLGD